MLVETIQSTTFRARGDYIKHTIPRLRITLLVETIQSTQFHAGGDNRAQHSTLVENYIKHTIPCLWITLQFHARGDNTKHTVPRWWKQYRAQHSALTESTQNSLQKTTLPYIQWYDTYDITKHDI